MYQQQLRIVGDMIVVSDDLIRHQFLQSLPPPVSSCSFAKRSNFRPNGQISGRVNAIFQRTYYDYNTNTDHNNRFKL